MVDDSLTKTEFNNDGVRVNVTLPTGTQVGDTVILKIAGGNPSVDITYDTYTVKEADLSGNGDHVATITIPKASLSGVTGGDYTITAQVKDNFGNASPVSDPDNFKVDLTAPGGGNGTGEIDDGTAPTVEVTDDLLNKTEFDNGVSVKVTLPEGTQVGDTVILKVTGGTLSEGITYDTYTVQDSDLTGGGDHVATITIPKASLPGAGDGEYTITAQVKDGVGQLSPVSGSDNFTVDTKLDDGLKAEGNADDGSVTITIPADATKVVVSTQPAGDVTLTKDGSGHWTSSNSTVVPAPTGEGPFTTTIPGDQVADGSTVKVVAEDKAGNQATTTATAPDINDAPVLTLTKDPALGESFTAGQATAGTKLAHASATDADGDKVTLTLENNTDGYYRLDSATGDIYLTQKGADYVNGGSNLPDLQVKATDVRTDGNSLSNIESLNLPDTIARDESNSLEVTSNDGTTVKGETDPGSTVTVYNAKGELVGTATAGGDGSFSVTLTRTVTGQADPNQKLKVDTDGDGEPDTDVTTDASGNYSYTVNSPIVTGETLTVKSVDPNNNLAEKTTATPDRLAPNAPVIAISDDGTTITGTAEPGSTITLTVTPVGKAPSTVTTDKTGNTITVDSEGHFTVELAEPLTDKETVTATATDGALNTSLPSNEVTAPFINNNLDNISISLANDTGASPNDNITNDGSLKLSQPSSDATITHVEYKGDDGQYHEIALGENGAYVLPEGVYEAGEIRVTQQDADGAVKYSTNDVKFVVDTTPPAPATAVRDVSSGNVVITLPTSAEAGDTVQVYVGNQEVTLTRNEDGTWASNNDRLVNVPAGTADGGQIVISASGTIPSGTGISVQSFDVAGNSADKDNDSFVLDTTKVTVVFANPEVNSDLSNDPDGEVLLNAEEFLASGFKSSVNYTIYLPHTAKVGDSITFPLKPGYSVTRTIQEGQILDDYSFSVSPIAGNKPAYNGLNEGDNTIQVTFTPQGSTAVSDSLDFKVDRLTPDMPQVVSQEGGAVQIDLPSKTTATIPDPTSGIGEKVQNGDWVIVTAGDQSVKLIRENGAWKEEKEVAWLTINGTKAMISQGNFDYGTTITAQAFDSAGNKSAIDTGHVVQEPLQYTGFRITNTDKNASTANVVDTNDGTIRYEATISGQEDKEAMILVQLVNSRGDVVNQQYLDITADKTTYTGAFTGLVADSQEYQLRSSIVDKATKASLTNSSTLPQRNADFILDNVAPKIESITLNKDNSLTVMVSDGANQVTDTESGKVVSTVVNEPMTLNMSFGDTSNDKQHVIADPMGNTVAVSSPKLDWLMRYDDDSVQKNPSANDHAEGWSNTYGSRWFTWNGSDTASDTIIASKIKTDYYYTDSWKQGLIGTEDGYMGWVHAFDMNTRGGGDDYIQSQGIAGYVRIWTNDGNDKITTNFMIGAANTFKYGDFDGSSQISMGSGNDSFTVNGNFASAYTGGTDGDWAGLFKTNAKIDMGDGDDTVSIANGIYTGNQVESGNYINLGAGDDKMTTGTISSEFADWEGSNIINLGTGHDTLTVNGNIESDSGDRPARFMLYSEDSSTVTINGELRGRSAMLMGNGNDNITINKVQLFEGDNELRWLKEVFDHTGVNSHYGFFGADFYGDLPKRVEEALTRSNAVDDSTGGNLRLHSSGTASRIDLGNGENTFWVKGDTYGARIVGGQDVDHINLGTDPNADGGINYNAHVNHTLIATGDGNDAITLVGVQEKNYVNSGAGNDTIEIHGITNMNNMIDGGADDDTIKLYGKVNSDNTNVINGGTGYDTLIIGNNGDDRTDNFVIGGSDSGHTQLYSIEKIQFNSVNVGDKVKVHAAEVNVSHTLHIMGTDSMDDSALTKNKVELVGNWQLNSNPSYQEAGYKLYTYSHDNVTERVYIDDSITTSVII